MKALVLAAGLGTRLRPYTYLTPKPLFSIAGVTMLDRIIGQLAAAGCSEIMVNTHHLSRSIEEHVKSSSYQADVKTVYEPVILETGGAVRNLESFWDDDPFFVVNSDIFTDFDFSLIYSEHIKSGASATLLMHDEPRFNNVSVSNDGSIKMFRTESALDGRLLAFTGIQVVSPKILDCIPVNIPYSIIDAYRNLISKGEKVSAFVPGGFKWEDIGTPEAYLSISKKILSEKVFSADYSELKEEKLKGDGSDRKWFRMSNRDRELILSEHGIKNTESTCEAESFFYIGRHLGEKGISVPEIIDGDVLSGYVFVEDLGNTHLADFVNSARCSEDIKKMYEKVISGLAAFSSNGLDSFNPSWSWQTRNYSSNMVLEKECHYFRDSFLRNYLGFVFNNHDLASCFDYISEGASLKGFKGLMHRDFQSRNIMIRGGNPYFIDFQGARLGPFEYDLASLLIDPYVMLDDGLLRDLEDHAFKSISAFADYDRDDFNESLSFCKVARNLQILGAFSFLSMVKGKKYFEDYIPASVSRLERNLSHVPEPDRVSFLLDIVSKAGEKICGG